MQQQKKGCFKVNDTTPPHPLPPKALPESHTTRWERWRGKAFAIPARQAVSLEPGRKKQGSWAKQLWRTQRENYSQDCVLNT